MKHKVAIIGAGYVGSTIAYTIMNWGLVSEISLIDIDEERAEGEMMDLSHGASFVKPVKVNSGGYEKCSEARIIIITAGANQKPGETRLDLVKKNTEIFKDIIPQITEYNQEAVLLVVTNPVDILTYVTYKLSGFPVNRVIGSGTVLDTSRLRHLLSNYCGINPRNVHAYIIGEHGDHEVVAWSLTNIAGVKFDNYCHVCEKTCPLNFKKDVQEKVKNYVYHVIEKKGATYYSVGLAVTRIVESILRNENSILTVSSMLQGEYGIEDMALSVPNLVGNNGISKILDLDIAEKEIKDLQKSADLLKDITKDIDLY